MKRPLSSEQMWSAALTVSIRESDRVASVARVSWRVWQSRSEDCC